MLHAARMNVIIVSFLALYILKVTHFFNILMITFRNLMKLKPLWIRWNCTPTILIRTFFFFFFFFLIYLNDVLLSLMHVLLMHEILIAEFQFNRMTALPDSFADIYSIAGCIAG